MAHGHTLTAQLMMEKKNYCPNCQIELVRKPNVYALEGVFYSGLVCEKCNSIWSDGDEEGFGAFIEHAKSRNTGHKDSS
jgi:hypothetical protein